MGTLGLTLVHRNERTMVIIFCGYAEFSTLFGVSQCLGGHLGVFWANNRARATGTFMVVLTLWFLYDAKTLLHVIRSEYLFNVRWACSESCFLSVGVIFVQCSHF